MKLSDFFPEMEGFTPVVSSVAKTPQIPNPETQITPFLRAPLPLPLQYSGDTIKQYNRPGLSSFRMAPLTPGGNASANAAAKSAISSAITTAIDSIPPTTTTTVDNDIITAISYASLPGGFDTSYSQAAGNFPANGPLTTIGYQSVPNQLVIALGMQNINGTQKGAMLAPTGGGWTQLGASAYWKVLSAAGAETVSQPQANGGGVWTEAQVVAFLVTAGNPIVFTLRASGGGNTPPFVLSTFTPAAGNGLILFGTDFDDNNAPSSNTQKNYSVTDNVGNKWVQLGNAFASATAGGFFHPTQATMWYCKNVAAVPTTVTVSGGRLASISLYEVNITNVTTQNYTFGSSDANKLLEFAGNAVIVATLPNPAMAAGWQVLVSNITSGSTVTLAVPTPAAALLNNSTQTVIIPSGSSVWVTSDGTNYWTAGSVGPANTTAPTNQFLNSYNQLTGGFGSAQVDFTNLSGNIAVGQMAAGVGASALTYWRGDQTWATPIGGVSVKAANYTAVAGDNGKLLAFNTVSLPGLVQSAKNDFGGAVSSQVKAFGSNNTAANMIVVLASNAGTNAGTVTISDTNLNTYTNLFTDVTINGSVQAAWFALNIAGGANTVTVSWSTGAQSSAMAIAEYSNVLTAAALDQSNKSTGTGNWSTPTLTTTQGVELLVAFSANANGGETVNSPFTQRQGLFSGGGLPFIQLSDNYVAATGAYQATGNGVGNFVGELATFKGTAPSTTYTLTLPASPPNSTWFISVQNFGIGTLTVSPNGKNLDGSTSNVNIASGKGMTIFTDGSNYFSTRGGS
jgi:hypothetical protein